LPANLAHEPHADSMAFRTFSLTMIDWPPDKGAKA